MKIGFLSQVPALFLMLAALVTAWKGDVGLALFYAALGTGFGLLGLVEARIAADRRPADPEQAAKGAIAAADKALVLLNEATATRRRHLQTQGWPPAQCDAMAAEYHRTLLTLVRRGSR